MDISTITGFLKLPKKVYFLGAIVGGMLLFLNESMLAQLGLLSFKASYSMWIGIFFLVTFGMSVIFVAESIFLYAKQRNEFKQRQIEIKSEEERLAREAARQKEQELQDELKEKEMYLKVLTRLDNYEKAVLRELFLSKKNTEELCFDDATVMGLIKKGVLKQVSTTAYHTDITGHVGKFRIDDRAIDYLESFDFNTINHISRPSWVEKIEIYQSMQNKILDLGRQIKYL
ncbi:super-infection exclusion protein B [Shewanella marina]|uniref:super-infection exclusion protein B n=1 Tax=Shewanella marina TaxID=487319 RepID=UPI00047065D5|nr:super-infection exclusion protein B [Shewanella marina]